MTERYDVIVAGLGAMGSASAYHLAARGRRVLGLERFGRLHAMGSSHGDSRIIREMYYEHPLYVPLVRRAYRLWEALEAEAGAELMTIHGGLMVGPRDGMLVTGTLRSATEHALPYELLEPREVRARFPVFGLADDLVAVWDPRAGFLRPEACVDAHLALAARRGADLRFEEPALRWAPDGDGVRVTTPKGEYLADRLLLTAGAWTREFLHGLDLPLEVERQVLWWLDPPPGEGEYEPARCPIYAWEHTPGYIGYGFPRLAKGVKAALMHQGEVSPPDAVRRAVGAAEVEPLRRALAPVLPGLAAAPARASAVCLFTNTPDFHFAIGLHPGHPQVLVSTPCSGHGFKFASAIGELHADLLTEGATPFDLSPFRLDRF